MTRKALDDIIVRKKPAVSHGPVRPVAPRHFEERGNAKTRKSKTLGILGFFGFVGLFWLGVSFFSSTLIKVTPRQESKVVNDDFQAGESVDLKFEVLEMDYQEEKEVIASDMTSVENKASGKIVIYNAYSSQSQTLIKNTRFETPDGKIYRIDKKITVPGSPGSVEATVYADEAGDSYNIGLTDFTIPGFKGSPRYEKFYARSQTEMTGGFKGVSFVAGKEDLSTIDENIRDNIKEHLRDAVLGKVPKGMILYDNALVFNFKEADSNPEIGDAVEEKFKYKLTGTVTGFLFEKESLSNEVVRRFLSKDLISKVRVQNIEDLKFGLVDRAGDDSKLVFHLQGEAQFVWNIDTSLLVADLNNAKKGYYTSVFKQYPDIEKAEIVFRPSWWRTISSRSSGVKFEEILKD